MEQGKLLCVRVEYLGIVQVEISAVLLYGQNGCVETKNSPGCIGLYLTRIYSSSLT